MDQMKSGQTLRRIAASDALADTIARAQDANKYLSQGKPKQAWAEAMRTSRSVLEALALLEGKRAA